MSALEKMKQPQFADKYELKKEDGIDNWSVVEIETGEVVPPEDVLKMVNRIQVLEARLTKQTEFYNAQLQAMGSDANV